MPRNALEKFFTSESGAITVDWVVLTGAICLMGVTFVGMVARGQNQIGDRLETTLTTGAGTLPGDGLNFGD